MTEDVMEYWLGTRKNAVIGNVPVKPIEHQFMKGKPLSSQKGQAIVYFLAADNGELWMLKKFHNNQSPDKEYLGKIKTLLPQEQGFDCGTKREVLSGGALGKAGGFHYSKELDNWLDGTILMPRIKGYDWACLADDLRDGNAALDMKQRLTICLQLTELIRFLEESQCCHRDLSCGNVFIDLDEWKVHLIDFDCLFHPSLKMPKATTCGTNGYICHLAWDNSRPDAAKTWCPYADRFALAILNTEFLLTNPGIKATGDGGMFEQQELKNQSGKTLDSILLALNSGFPEAAHLLEAAVKSSGFADCPSPQDWLDLYNSAPDLIVKPLGIDELPEIPGQEFSEVLTKVEQTQAQPAPKLDETTEISLKVPKTDLIDIPPVKLADLPEMSGQKFHEILTKLEQAQPQPAPGLDETIEIRLQVPQIKVTQVTLPPEQPQDDDKTGG